MLKEGARSSTRPPSPPIAAASSCSITAPPRAPSSAFTRALAQSLAERKIRVNGVAPGPDLDAADPGDLRAPKKVASFGTNVPMGRPGEPNEVAPCHLFLACDNSSYITGQVLHPNGGEIVGG